ncbi:MAG TPA: DUF1549 and DUF1553 domain-containing protein [Gemmataceae bacterium]|nr:DUF1549 and DUF1553 domain-containing protein [Gemmataceae bacterium]
MTSPASVTTVCLLAGALLAGLAPAARAEADARPSLSVFPADFTLRGKAARQQLIVTAIREGRVVDVTRGAEFRSETPAVVQVSAEGVATPVGSGMGTVLVTVGGQQARATVRVIDGERYLPVTLEQDVIPVLTRAGCNAGACHGKARGQNGFQLSLLGFDPDFDFAALVQEGRGRRLFPAAPEHSLLLRKPTGQTSHGGGKRLQVGDAHYEVLRRWIAAGTPRKPADAPVLERISIEPAERLLANHAEQQLAVTAHYSDGSTCDVTHLATFQSNDSTIAAVSPDGRIKAGALPGEAAVMARFKEKFAVCNVIIPLPGSVPAGVYARLPRANFIDEHVWNKLQRLGLTPSERASDATFLRRAYLDAIGRLPTPAEVREFLSDPAPDKRVRLVDRLLERPEYADYWANKWADLLRPNPYRVGIKAVFNLDAWLRDAFRQNKPYNQFVREILTAQGSTFRDGPVTVFRDRREPEEITTMVSQLFLGIRLECAKCHHHPFEVWGQDDFYSFAAYFAGINRKGTGISPPISGSEEIFYPGPRREVKHPATGQVMSPRPLFGKAAAPDAEGDLRRVLADWIVSDDNPYFARVIVNRVWADLMGRGLVEPVDDLRATNPPSNGPLLDALAADFRKQGYDLKKLLRTIMTSEVYGLSSVPNERNAADTRNYSRHYRQRLRAEVLLDAISDITQVPETFAAMPPGSRAMELWTVRSQSVFLDSFGRPDPNQDPPCERTGDTSVVQALHLMNSPNLHRKVTSDQGRAAELAASSKSPAEIVDELYALVYSRFPSDEERRTCLRLFEGNGTSRRQVIEDLMWALINTPEFVFKD